MVFYPLAVLLAALLALLAWRYADHRADAAAWLRLADLAQPNGATFDPAQLAGLPEPAHRYFTYTIAPGTPIRTAVRIEMTGTLGLGTKDAPKYQPMNASQILSPPHGLVWKVRTGPLSGSDGALPDGSWTRFWLLNLIPVVRAHGPDHHRAAFGRVIAEAAFWSPTSLLPGEGVTWSEVDPDTARATVTLGAFSQVVDITVDASGAPKSVFIQRWSNENPERTFREQPFGGTPSEFRDFGGYRLPTRVEGGNHFGTPAYFPFFKARVTEIGAP
ncbi:DUF6544 family protein [Rhodophyticola sp. MJ-SS7]|nr:DUF6544 family protein [Rhodophyticola sp. MJ-SS7]